MQYHYDSLNFLASVVREGGFEAAANSLNVTQSAISQRIKQLEDKVGSVLIIRGRPCIPTEIGLQLCQHAEQVTLLQHELTDRLSTLIDKGGDRGATIRIAVNNDSLASWFPNVLKRAVNELSVQIEIIPDDQEHTEKSLISGDALAVITDVEKPVAGCRRISLGAMEYIAVASPEFHQAHFSKGVSPDTLENTPCLAFDRKDTLQSQWMRLCFNKSVKTRTHMIPSYEGYLSCCLNGAAWGLVPGVAGVPHLERGELIELEPKKRINISLHWQSSTQSSEILRRLGQLVKDEARRHLIPDSFRPS